MGSRATGDIRIGIGGWNYAPWRGTFYPDELPQKRELEYVSRRVTSIEINSTFYGLQKPQTFAKWRDATPEGFVFSLKAPRFTTNRTVLGSAGDSIANFLSSGIVELKEKLGPINWQLAPTKQFDSKDFEAFLKLLPKKAGGRLLRHAVEVRHESFRCKEFVALLRKYQIAVVLAGDSIYPQIADMTAAFGYARIMGTKESQKLGYGKKSLDLWAARVRAWSSGLPSKGLDRIAPPKADGKPRDVYLYVISGDKIRNPAAATALLQRLG
jgi:uncharacterized protein YecE (DUF72 family)